MADAKFTEDDLNTLKKANAYFDKPAEERNRIFAKTDPFPDISDALLNSADIIKYVLVTGMIEPFDIKKLSGATYTCEFSGDYIFWDSNRIKNKGSLSKDEPLHIKQNSIVFLGIKPMFYVPEYIVLRFNLRVKNVYKGLLLGTGPIIDPGYVGKLFIPLHNFTANEYNIKLDALLISIEFTKLSKNNAWKLDAKAKNILNTFKQSLNNIPYIPRRFPSKRDTDSYDKYIEEALTADPYFCKQESNMPFVNSSLEEEIKHFGSMQESTKKKLEELEFLKSFFTFTIAATLIAGLTLFASTGWYFFKAREISNIEKNIKEQEKLIDKYREDSYNNDNNIKIQIQKLGEEIRLLKENGEKGK